MSFQRSGCQGNAARGESQGASLPSNVLRAATIRRPGKRHLAEADVFLVEAPELGKPAQAAYDTLFGAAYDLSRRTRSTRSLSIPTA